MTSGALFILAGSPIISVGVMWLTGALSAVGGGEGRRCGQLDC